ncbi:hypothetical protein SLA2020_453930 [Shorea laevis]
MATPFPGLQHRDGGGGVAVMAGTVNAIDPSPSMACVKNNPALKPPILIFLFFHKAIRSELEGLHRAAMAFATGVGDIKPCWSATTFSELFMSTTAMRRTRSSFQL